MKARAKFFYPETFYNLLVTQNLMISFPRIIQTSQDTLILKYHCLLQKDHVKMASEMNMKCINMFCLNVENIVCRCHE